MKIILALVFSIMTPSVWARGGAVGNGGGFAICQDQQYYAYDYFLSGNSPLAAPPTRRSVQDRLAFIISNLERLNDPLAIDLKNFVATQFTQTHGAKFQWFQRTDLELMMESFEDSLPTGCATRIQAVFYFGPTDGQPYASYTYDPNVIANVQSQVGGDLQLSYLWVHEWLWNYFSRDDFMRLARFNRVLQSEGLDTMTEQQYAAVRPASGRSSE